MSSKLRYRLLTGANDRAFCERVSQALDEGYELYGSPSIISENGTQTVKSRTYIFLL